MASMFHQPGFRFHPTDVELIMYYLRKKVNGKQFRFNAIAEVRLYECAPWELKEKLRLPSRDLVWFFFCARDKKYGSGKQTNRATKYGLWKTTGDDKPISYKSKIVGRRRTLIFYKGKASKENRTDWVMHEYRIENDDLINAGFSKDSYVICKVFQKSGPGPKNGEQYGAPFDENEWDDDVPLAEPSSAALGPEISDNLVINSTVESVDGHNFALDQLPQQSGSPVPTEAQHFSFVYDDTEFFDAEELRSEICGGSGSCNEVKSDAPIPQENGQENAMCNDHEIYDGLDQIIGPEELDAGKEHYLGNLQDIYEPIILTFQDGSFLEMDDLLPMQDDPVGNETTGDLYVHRSTVSMPASQEVDTSQSNWEPLDAVQTRNAEETVANYIPSSSARDKANQVLWTSGFW